MPWVKVHRYVINQDKKALAYFNEQLKQFDAYDFSVPTVMFCGARWLGFSNAASSGKIWVQALEYCREQIIKTGSISPVTTKVLQQWSASENVITNPYADRSELSVIFTLAVLDAYGPCSLFCFILFLAFLWLYPQSRWRQFWVGSCFIVVLGLMQFLLQRFPDVYFMMLPHLRVFAVVVGGVLLKFGINNFLTRKQGKNTGSVVLLIPALLFSVIAVYAYQQTCEMKMGIVFEQWLHSINLTSLGYIFYRILYLCFYLASLMLLLFFYLIFGVHPRKMLFIAASTMLSAIGLILIAQPTMLVNALASVVVFVFSLFIGWFLSRR